MADTSTTPQLHDLEDQLERASRMLTQAQRGLSLAQRGDALGGRSAGLARVLQWLGDAATEVELATATAVQLAREDGATWDWVGRELRVSRQAAWRRFHDTEEAS